MYSLCLATDMLQAFKVGKVLCDPNFGRPVTREPLVVEHFYFNQHLFKSKPPYTPNFWL